jgi:hypothetical protein
MYTRMKKIENIILLLLIFIIIGCGSSDKEKHTAKNIITLSDDELDKQYKASDIFADITLIPLETTDESIIGYVSKMVIVDSVIYILDGQTKSLLMFDMQGHFLSKIHNVGNGPNEYVGPEDFTVMNNKDILIQDQTKKLLHFKNDGTPYKTYFLPFFADALEMMNDTLIVFCGAGFDDRVIIWDIKNEKIVNSFIKYDVKYSMRIFKPLIKYADDIYFRRCYSSVIYKVTAEQLIEQWFIDYGERNITDDKIVTAEDGTGLILPHTMDMYRFTETKNHVMFIFQIAEFDLKKRGFYFLYYSKTTNNKIITIADMYDNNMSFSPYLQQILDKTESGQVFEVLYSGYYLEDISKYDTTAMDTETRLRWRYIQGQLKGVTEFDNPIVALYSLKDF